MTTDRCGKTPCLLCDVLHSSVTASLVFFLIVVCLALLCADVDPADVL